MPRAIGPAGALADGSGAAADDPAAREDVVARPPRRRWTAVVLRGIVGTIAAAALLAVGVSVGRRDRPAPPARAVVPVIPEAIAILPFALETSHPALAFLHEGAADLMTRMLDDGVGPRVVDPGAVLAALDSAPTPDASPPGTAAGR